MIIYAADDEKLALNFLRDLITETVPEAELTCFTKSSELLKKASETPPDIVFLDIEMPGLNGIETAEKLNEIKDNLNIIFVTGYKDYALDAFNVYASGYLTKPCKQENLSYAISHLRYPIEEKKDIEIKTFGNFDIFYKGNPVSFRSPKAKELLAYLVDREGAVVTRAEVAGILFEDDFSHSVQVRLTKFATRLSEDLEVAGISDFFINDNGYHVNLSVAECDLAEYLKGNTKYTYCGEYMEQYSWGEYRKGYLDEIK